MYSAVESDDNLRLLKEGAKLGVGAGNLH